MDSEGGQNDEGIGDAFRSSHGFFWDFVGDALVLFLFDHQRFLPGGLLGVFLIPSR